MHWQLGVCAHIAPSRCSSPIAITYAALEFTRCLLRPPMQMAVPAPPTAHSLRREADDDSAAGARCARGKEIGTTGGRKSARPQRERRGPAKQADPGAFSQKAGRTQMDGTGLRRHRALIRTQTPAAGVRPPGASGLTRFTCRGRSCTCCGLGGLGRGVARESGARGLSLSSEGAGGEYLRREQ
ncbi:hypothetical protein C2E23DRAFT_448713 [Lenzites betulinus]|nr:hypothetical protein C2E23DRAFT_448713 [Lenzites betulinus]